MTSIIEDIILSSQYTFIAGVICNIINACNYLHFIKTRKKMSAFMTSCRFLNKSKRD